MPDHHLAQRLQSIPPFRVMQVLHRAAQLEAAGHPVVHFEVGEPDFVTAQPIIQAGTAALQQGHTKYTSATGIEPLREAIAEYYASQGVDVSPHRIIVTAGASGGLTLLAAMLLNPNDGLLITDPGYPCNEVFAQLVGAQPAALVVTPGTGFQPTADQVGKAWQDATAGVLLASPANPTGTMLSSEALTEIAQVVATRNGFFILDEIYQGLVNNSAYATGLAVVPDLYVLNSFSKFFGMTGWRLGWIVVPDDSVDAATRLAQNLFICPSAPAQYAALAAFSDSAMDIHRTRAEAFRQRGSQLLKGLRELGFTVPVEPDGAFYLYVDVSHTGLSGQTFCTRLLEDSHVAVTPGEDFGTNECTRYVRFAFTTSTEQIDLGLQRIRGALQDWGVS